MRKNQLVVHRYLKNTPDSTHSDAAGCVFYDLSSSFAGIAPFYMVILSQLKKQKNKNTFHASVLKMLPTNVTSAFTPAGLMRSYYALQLVPLWNLSGTAFTITAKHNMTSVL